MNKLGLFWAKNTTHILGLYFLGWAIWACLHWASLCLVQKLVMGLFFLLVAHEYEEAYKERFFRVMGQAIGIKPEELPVPELIHVAADSFIAVMFSLALVDLSKLPEDASETLRIVRVGDYDACACAGAHVGNTSEVGRFEILSHDFDGTRWRVRWRVVE